jgi:hypothetical protein
VFTGLSLQRNAWHRDTSPSREQITPVLIAVSDGREQGQGTSSLSWIGVNIQLHKKSGVDSTMPHAKCQKRRHQVTSQRDDQKAGNGLFLRPICD